MMVAFDGQTVKCNGISVAALIVGINHFQTELTVVDEIVGGIDFMIGMDIIQRLGGVLVQGKSIQFGNIVCAVQCQFQANGDREDKAVHERI